MSTCKRWLIAVFGLAVVLLGTPAPAHATGWELLYQEWVNEGINDAIWGDPGAHSFIESSNDPYFPINAAFGEIFTHADAAAPTVGSPIAWDDYEGIYAYGDYHAVFMWDGPPNPGPHQLSGIIQFAAFAGALSSDVEPYWAWDDPSSLASGNANYLGGEYYGGQDASMSATRTNDETLVYDDDCIDVHPIYAFSNNNGNDEVMEGTVCDLEATACADAHVLNGESWAMSQGSGTVSVTFSAEEVP